MNVGGWEGVDFWSDRIQPFSVLIMQTPSWAPHGRDWRVPWRSWTLSPWPGKMSMFTPYPRKAAATGGRRNPSTYSKPVRLQFHRDIVFYGSPFRAYRKIRFNITMTVKQEIKNCYNDFKFVIMNFRIRSNGLNLWQISRVLEIVLTK